MIINCSSLTKDYNDIAYDTDYYINLRYSNVLVISYCDLVEIYIFISFDKYEFLVDSHIEK